MPVRSSEGQMRNSIAYCLLFAFLIVGPGVKSPLIAVGLAGSYQWSSTHAPWQTRLRESTWNTRKLFLACRKSWLIGRAIGEINQSKSNVKTPVLSVPYCAGKSHLWCSCFFLSHFEQHKEHVPSIAHEAACYLLLPEPFSQDLLPQPWGKPLAYNGSGDSCY